jgi:hypothetical protein
LFLKDDAPVRIHVLSAWPARQMQSAPATIAPGNSTPCLQMFRHRQPELRVDFVFLLTPHNPHGVAA